MYRFNALSLSTKIVIKNNTHQWLFQTIKKIQIQGQLSYVNDARLYIDLIYRSELQ